MNGRTLIGTVLLVLGLVLAAVGGYELATGGGPPFGPGTVIGTPDPTGGPPPSPTPTPPPAATPTPATTPQPSPEPSPTPQPSPTGAETEAAIRGFLDELVAAIRAGEVHAMAGRLHDATIDRYGLAACETKLANDQADATYEVVIVEIHPLAPWDYITDERTTTIAEAWTIDADVTAQGTTARRQVHLAPMDGEVTWFSDCGDPLPGQ
ncbi:MAG: hypothetical protein AB1736_00920 [Chloroflexota bacterium]